MGKQATGRIEFSKDSRVARPVVLDDIQRLNAQIKILSNRLDVHRGGCDVRARSIRTILMARQERRDHFDPCLFADPAWDILLELYALELEQRRVSVSKLCLSAGVPATTALRWIDKLYEEGLISREADPVDGRRIWVSLSCAGSQSMRDYFDRRGTGPVPI